MTISVDLPPEQAAKLEEAARKEGMNASALLTRLVNDYLERKEAFEAAANAVLQKNAEFYRRLAI